MAFELHEPGGPVRLSFKTLDAVYDTRAVIGGDVHVQRGTPPRGALLSRNCVTQIVLRFQGTRGIDSLQFTRRGHAIDVVRSKGGAFVVMALDLAVVENYRNLKDLQTAYAGAAC